MTYSQILQTALRNHVPVDLETVLCSRCLNKIPLKDALEDEDGESAWCQNCAEYYEAQAEFNAANVEEGAI